jgi:hypothetical protein
MDTERSRRPQHGQSHPHIQVSCLSLLSRHSIVCCLLDARHEFESTNHKRNPTFQVESHPMSPLKKSKSLQGLQERPGVLVSQAVDFCPSHGLTRHRTPVHVEFYINHNFLSISLSQAS